MNDHEKILKHYGVYHQMEKCVEEMVELTEEIQKTPANFDAIRSEIADVKNVLIQLETYFDNHVRPGEKTIKQWQEFKLKRTLKRMK
jgi:NTP pyrophosphatase (non-canonical NTP hydrolase)